MANNRLLLKCKVCNEVTVIAKFYPSEAAGWYARDSVASQMNDFFDKHYHYHLDGGLEGGYQYIMEYEMYEDEKKSTLHYVIAFLGLISIPLIIIIYSLFGS